MTYRIEEKPAFVLAGKGLRVKTEASAHLRAISDFWRSVPHTEPLYAMQKPDGVIGRAVLGVCADYSQEEAAFTYEIAVEVDDAANTADYTRRAIPATTWAVFESVGKIPEKLHETWQRVFGDELPSGGYQIAAGLPQIERYPPGDVSADDYVCEVWIPVVRQS